VRLAEGDFSARPDVCVPGVSLIPREHFRMGDTKFDSTQGNHIDHEGEDSSSHSERHSNNDRWGRQVLLHQFRDTRCDFPYAIQVMAECPSRGCKIRVAATL
jgi:hypothetical protein